MCWPISSITKKQIVAVTGLMLVMFIIAHLMGNLFIYGGPEAFNNYAHKLRGLGALLWAARAGLLLAFLTHITFTCLLVMENIEARGGLGRYALDNPVAPRSLATRFMALSGAYIFIFVVWHLLDFTFIDQHGPHGMLNGIDQGIYGVVVNAFADPLHAVLYVLAMCFLGLHLHHGVQSVMQSFGFNHPVWTPVIKKISEYFSLLIAVGYSSIPMYVFFIVTT